MVGTDLWYDDDSRDLRDDGGTDLQDYGGYRTEGRWWCRPVEW